MLKDVVNMKSFVIWLTGLSGSGKSTIAENLEHIFREEGLKVERLDGDTVRDIFPNTGFTKEARDEHVKRIGFIASLLERNGVVVIVSLISPYRESREFVRNMCGNFIEVYVSASLEECERRDVKGLYERVRKGEIKNFTGIDDPYEKPEHPEIVIDTESYSIEESAGMILQYLKRLN